MQITDVDPAADADTGDAAILKEAVERFKAAQEWQGTEDERAREDIKFANGDSRNAWMWPTKVYEERTNDGNDLPCLTINITRTHNDLIINEICKQDFGIKVRPVKGKASYQAAKIMEALIRRIQDQSAFSVQRRKVAEHQVDGGIGHMLLETRWASEKSSDQDIFLRAARDPTSVYEDPWIKESDGSDKNFKFEFERLPREEFNRKYPQYKNAVSTSPIDSIFSAWINDKEICLLKYWRKRQIEDVLVGYKDDKGETIERLKSEIIADAGPEIYDALLAEIKAGTREGRTRKTTNNTVEWFLIAGAKIVDRGDWVGSYIPGARCVGRETVIDQTLDRKGHTRPLIDSQRMLNYYASSDVQHNFSQTKAPWLAPARAIEGQEQWKSANINNFAVLTYVDVDEDQPTPLLQQIPPPQKIPPPAPSPAYQAGMANAERQMMMISGQWQSQVGMEDQQSANSGRAINARKMQSDTASYHFFEHQSDMLCLLGKQLLDLIPKIYDTKRALQVIGEDGEKFWIEINPHQDDAIVELEREAEDEEAIKVAFNPSLGEFECVSDPGPDYATQRQEAANALTLIFTQAKELVGVAGDLLFKYSDFQGADEVFARLQKEIEATKPYLFGKGPPPAIQALNEQIQKLTQLNGELVQKIAVQEIKHKGYEEKRDVEAFNAQTKRVEAMVNAIAKIALTPAQQRALEHEIELAGHQHVYNLIERANEADLNDMASSAEPEGAT